MQNLSINWWIEEYMIYCRSKQLRERTLDSYEQTLRLFERWCMDTLNLSNVDKISESVIRRYVGDLQERGKYTFYVNDNTKDKNFPERRRDFRQPVSVCTINNYIRNLRAFFNWLDRDYIIQKNPMKKIKQLKTNRKAKEYISDEDFKKLISFFYRSYFSEHRNFTMIILMIDSEMRLGECSNRPDRIDFQKPVGNCTINNHIRNSRKFLNSFVTYAFYLCIYRQELETQQKNSLERNYKHGNQRISNKRRI